MLPIHEFWITSLMIITWAFPGVWFTGKISGRLDKAAWYLLGKADDI